MAIRWEGKRPSEVRDYTHDWSNFLGDDSIDTSTWTASGATIDSDEFDDTNVTVWISGGASGAVARFTNEIVTIGGRRESETFVLFVSEYEEPISYQEAAVHLRLGPDDDSERSAIEGYIRAARQLVEAETGKLLVRQEVIEARRPDLGSITPYWGPVVEAEVTDFADTRIVGGRIYPASGSRWPLLTYPDQFELRYVAGYGAGEVPAALIQAMLIMLVPMYERRPPTEDEQRSFASLCAQFRAVSL